MEEQQPFQQQQQPLTQEQQLHQQNPQQAEKERSRSRSPNNDVRNKGQTNRNPADQEKRHGGENSKSPGRGWDVSRAKFMIPQLDGPLLSMNEFIDMHDNDRVEIETNKAELHYQYYKKSWERRQNEIFTKEHCEDQWFIEKYDPIESEAIFNQRKEDIKKFSAEFFEDYKNNKFDSISLEISQKDLIEVFSSTEQETKEFSFENYKHQTNRKVFFGPNFDVKASPYFGCDISQRSLCIKSIPRDVGRKQLFEVIQKVPGFQSLTLSEPNINLSFQRTGWITFESEERCAYTCARFKKDILMINQHELNVVENPTRQMILIADKAVQKKSLKDFEYVIKLITSLDAVHGVTENPLLESADSDFSYKRLDVCLLYLRRVHGYCYYSGVYSHDEKSLLEKCGSIHLRIQREENEVIDTVMEENRHNWQDKAQFAAESLQKQLDEKSQHPHGAALLRERVANKIIVSIRKALKVDTGAWPCIYCIKKFKDAEFVVKHIENKHPTEEKFVKEVEKIKQMVVLDLYSLDKQKITHQAPKKERQTSSAEEEYKVRMYRKFNGNYFPAYPLQNRKFVRKAFLHQQPQQYQGQPHHQSDHHMHPQHNQHQHHHQHQHQHQHHHQNQHNNNHHHKNQRNHFRDLDEPQSVHAPQVVATKFPSAINYLEI